MEYLVIYLLIYSLIQIYLYSVVAPNNRMRLRYKLYAIRDEIRRMEYLQKGENYKDIKTKTFIKFNIMLNYATQNMKEFNLYNMVSTSMSLKENPEEKKDNDLFISEIKNSPNERLRELFDEYNNVLYMTLIYNSIGYVFFGVIISLISLVFGIIKNLNNVKSNIVESISRFGVYAKTPNQGTLSGWFKQAGESFNKTIRPI
jgi:hypothetical protein